MYVDVMITIKEKETINLRVGEGYRKVEGNRPPYTIEIISCALFKKHSPVNKMLIGQ